MSVSAAAEDRFVQVGNVRFAYRLFGKPQEVPLLLLHGLRHHMDLWDPDMLDAIAAQRRVLLIDGAGLGRSGGVVPLTVAEMAQDFMDVIRALELDEVDVLGWSLGGFIAQLMVLNHGVPGAAVQDDRGMPKIRRLVLCATEPSFGQGSVVARHASTPGIFTAVTEEELGRAFTDEMFVQGSEKSMRAGRMALTRLMAAREKRGMLPLGDLDACQRQTTAIRGFRKPETETDGSYTRFEQLQLPVLVATGCHDVLCPTENSLLMWQKIKFANAQLHIFPDSGHGFFYQYPEEFAATVNAFLGAGAAGRKTG
ncbi:putative aminoacrylate hydrolase RutD [Escovopsis weberi]|uniref:Putative aminoacrylate hydrolase RutD n=1 Tax=Escovopsis weberi TaxID=150374 RepID=A0A0M8N1F6_ESCWE|nr:putative aminoacrylate hydrolase RutD [Escovopsis weberi]